jgi:hypothetical protein
MINGRRFAADVYGRKIVKPSINTCNKDTFAWYPSYSVKTQEEITTVVTKILRFNKGGIMVREA